MHRIDTPTAQVDKFGVGKNGFTAGNPQTGQLPTALDQDFFDSIQEEIAGVIESAAIALNKPARNQLQIALKKLFMQPVNNLSEIKTAGAAAVAAALSNLGLGTAATRDVGTGVNQIPDMQSFLRTTQSGVFTSQVIAGKTRLSEGNGSLSFSNGQATFTLPQAYPSAGFTIIFTDVGGGVFSFAASPINGSQVAVFCKAADGTPANSSVSYKYIAVGAI